jgi:hypothetical protein
MQSTTPIPVHPGFKTWSPSDDPPRVNPAETIEEAVRAGDFAKVASLVADASYSPPDYLERALIAAVRAKQLEIGRYLLDHGAKMDKPVKPLIHKMPGSYAARNESLPFLKLFIEYGWDINFTDVTGTALL